MESGRRVNTFINIQHLSRLFPFESETFEIGFFEIGFPIRDGGIL